MSVHANAQIRSSFSGTNQSTKLVLEKPVIKQKTKLNTTKSLENTEEYVLYRNVIRKYSWLVGQGEPISQDVANHLPYYFRLSMKNEQGHWQHIEAMHGDTLTSSHSLSPYFINKDYDMNYADNNWYQKINNTSQWFITSDLSGEYVAEERAYTKEGDMIYGFIPVINDSIHITGSYNDSWGRPVDFNEVEECTYGSVVYITYDINGCDSVIDFLDGQGLRKSNSNGVDQERFVYDKQLRPILSTSNNCVGDYMIDNWGNCGNCYEYSQDGSSYTITRVDQNLQPMRMPLLRASEENTYIRCKVNLDKWGREAEKIMLNEKNENDTTLSGIHRIKYYYNNYGRLISKSYYDLNGNQIK